MKDSYRKMPSQGSTGPISCARMAIKSYLAENLRLFGVLQIIATDMRTLQVSLSLTSNLMSASTCSKTHQKTQGRKKSKKKETSTATPQTQPTQDQASEVAPREIMVEIKNQDVKTFLSDNLLTH